MSKTSSTAKNRWNESHYERINLVVKFGRKEIIQKAAKREGISVNEFVNRSIADKLTNEEKKEWEA